MRQEQPSHEAATRLSQPRDNHQTLGHAGTASTPALGWETEAGKGLWMCRVGCVSWAAPEHPGHPVPAWHFPAPLPAQARLMTGLIDL